VTLDPVDTDAIFRVDGPDYTVGPYCANPRCGRIAEHAHHIVRRSATAGPADWVEINGEVFANKTGLCPDCHDMVTGRVGGHQAAIRLVHGVFVWCRVLNLSRGRLGFERIAPLEPQPPTPESLATRASATIEESDRCPSCGQLKRRRSAPHPGRRRKSWTVPVPADAEENGAEVLDTLVDDLAPLLHVEPNASGRYYVLVPALVYAQQDRKRFIDALGGRGG